MIELARIIEHQSALYSYKATKNEARALQLEKMIEETKPKDHYREWHVLVATPFRYQPAHQEARFRPRYGRNVFYGACFEETALYEHAYYFMKERIHLANLTTQAENRTIFFVNAADDKVENIKNNANLEMIMNKKDFSASHQFIESNPQLTFILYPSCRDPKHRSNAAILDINHLEKNINSEYSINFFYDNKKKKIFWLDYQLEIYWQDVA